jgi:ribosomal 50S subunit-associated protein YjgA (DUF615 family)
MTYCAQGLVEVGRHPDRAVEAVLSDHPVDEALHLRRLLGRGGHEGELGQPHAGMASTSRIKVLQKTMLPAPMMAILVVMGSSH